jgi:branched-chain amino acid transport system permease protein
MTKAPPLLVLHVPGLSRDLLPSLAPGSRLAALAAAARPATIRPTWPAVTCSVQASLTTGVTPDAHGIIANGLFTARIPAVAGKSVTLAVSMLCGAAAAGVAGLVVGAPTLRLRGDYLAIATLGFAQIIQTVANNVPALGRAPGLSVGAFANDAEFGDAAHYLLPWALATAVITGVIVWRVRDSRQGRALLCVREDEIAAAAVGIDTTAAKVLAFIVGAALAGAAGSLFAHADGFINPSQFSFTRSAELVVMVVLAGSGRVWGTALAAAALTLVQPVLQSLPGWLPPGTPDAVATAARRANDYRLLLFAAVLILAMLVRARLRAGRRNSVGAG